MIPFILGIICGVALFILIEEIKMVFRDDRGKENHKH